MTLVLASASPRRRELLRAAEIAFEVEPTDIPEVPNPGEDPEGFAKRMALQKAMTAAARRPPGNWILGADTIVVVGEQILGKPRDAADAARMLRLLSGRTHHVITAVSLIQMGKLRVYDQRSETTAVTFVELTDKDIVDYVKTGEPMDKAGAYAIQGIASRWIPRIEGDYSNVVGLPVALVCRMLHERNVSTK
jgi:septum formation protein